MACGLLYLMGMAVAEAQGSTPQQQVPGFGTMDSTIQSSTSQQQMASSSAEPVYDWLSPGGVTGVSYYGPAYPTRYYSWYPYYRNWYYPSSWYYYPSYTYWPGYYYNSFDPWWVANVYGPVRTTYYWYSY